MNTSQDLHVADLPAILAERGVEIGYRLTVAAPKGAVDDDLRRLLKKHRPTLAEALARAEAYNNPKITYAHVLTWDGQGFDWADGVQKLDLDDDAPGVGA